METGLDEADHEMRVPWVLEDRTTSNSRMILKRGPTVEAKTVLDLDVVPMDEVDEEVALDSSGHWQ